MLWNETAEVIDELARVAEVNQIDCGLRRCGSIMVARTEEDARSIEDEAIQLRDAGIETRILAADEVRSYFPLKSFMGGITYDAVSQVHPARLASGWRGFTGLRYTKILRRQNGTPGTEASL